MFEFVVLAVVMGAVCLSSYIILSAVWAVSPALGVVAVAALFGLYFYAFREL
jgi:hypothetical protein